MATRAPYWLALAALGILAAGCDTGGSDAQRTESTENTTTTTTSGETTGRAGATTDQGGQVSSDQQRELDTKLVEARVKSAVYEQLQNDAMDVDVKVDEGRVELSGKIRKAENQKMAEAAAQRIPGVTQVQNNLTVEAPAEARDEQPSPDDMAKAQDRLIEAKVRASLLEQLGPTALDIDVSVDRGEVQLSGNVRGADHKQHAISVAQGIAGVRGVKDNIDVNS